MTVNHEMDGEHTCSVQSIDETVEGEGRKAFFLQLQIVSGPYTEELITKEYRITCPVAEDHFKHDMEMLGVPVSDDHEKLAEMAVVAYGKRVRVRLETVPQGFTTCRILEVIEGDIPPEDDDDWLLDFPEFD